MNSKRKQRGRILRTAITLAMSVLVAGSLAAPARATDEYEIKVYPAQQALGPVTLDGVLDEESWEAATEVSGFTLYNSSELAQPQTQVRITYDEEQLYFGIVCQEPDMATVTRTPVPRDALAVFKAEAVEIFVDPRHSHSTYYQFGISCAGSVYDSRLKDRVWNADVHTGTRLGAHSWTVEVAIPWADLGVVPRPGTLLGFNVCRDRHAGSLQYTTWTRVKADFHDPLRFAHLLLSPGEQGVEALGEELRRGGRRGPIVVYGPEGYTKATYRALAEAAIDGLRKSLTELQQVATTNASTPAGKQLQLLVAVYEQKIEGLQAMVAANKRVEAGMWASLALEVDAVSADLSEAVWEARLQALLSRI